MTDRQRKRCGRKTRSGEPCKAWAMAGADVCRMHGGSAPQVQAAAQRRLAEAEARRATVTYGLPIEIEPHAALIRLLHLTAGAVEWLAAEVSALGHQWEEDEQTGEPRLQSGLRQWSKGRGGWEPAVLVDLYQTERKMLADVSAKCISAGIEERRVEIEKAKVELIAQAFRGFAIELGHDPAEPMVRTAFRKHLELVAGEAA